MKRTGKAFTLVELLVVISIIAILLAVLMPSLNKARGLAKRTICASNLRQWTIAIASYGNDNNGYFPYNGTSCPWCPANSSLDSDGECKTHGWKAGTDIAYGGIIVQRFWDKYILKRDKKIIAGENNVLYCPTQKWHRSSYDPSKPESADNVLNSGLCGYYFLTSKASWDTGNLPGGWNFGRNGNVFGGDYWVSKKRIGEKHRDLPIVMDIKQKFITGQAASWYNNGIVISSHAGSKGVPEGGNFLYEDGHIKWVRSNETGLGASVAGQWQCYYDIIIKYFPANY
ncbi:MAG: type II secretion system protein [Phycisphaerae bacterium]|jgi:prepilin-type N-terminal cleavage/methylation domain-containing protein